MIPPPAIVVCEVGLRDGLQNLARTPTSSRLGVRLDPPRLGEHTRALLSSLGLTTDAIDELYRQRAVA